MDMTPITVGRRPRPRYPLNANPQPLRARMKQHSNSGLLSFLWVETRPARGNQWGSFEWPGQGRAGPLTCPYACHTAAPRLATQGRPQAVAAATRNALESRGCSRRRAGPLPLYDTDLSTTVHRTDPQKPEENLKFHDGSGVRGHRQRTAEIGPPAAPNGCRAEAAARYVSRPEVRDAGHMVCSSHEQASNWKEPS